MHIKPPYPSKPHLRGDNTLHVIAVCFNPVRYHSRFRLFAEFIERMKRTPAVNLVIVEAAFGDRHHELTEAGNPNHLQLRTSDEVWLKENLANLAVRDCLPRDWKYAALVDADVDFLNPAWAQETLHQLQHHDVVQCWRDAIDLGPQGEIVERHQSLMYLHATGKQRQRKKADPYAFGHPGFAWAFTRRFYENVGGLIDFAVLGAADHHMGLAMLGEAEWSLPGGLHPNYDRLVLEWQARCERHLRRNVGFVPGTLHHHWHGPKKQRYYVERWGVLQRHQFDPVADLARNDQGVLVLGNHAKHGLRDDLRRYFRARLEDSIDGEV